MIEVRDGTLTHYQGDWEYYLWKKGRGAAQPAAGARLAPGPEPTPAAEAPPVVKPASQNGSGGGAVAAPTSPKLSYQQRKETTRRHRQVERRILELEERQNELGTTLSDPAFASDYELLISASDEATAVRDELAALYPEWEGLTEVVASLDDRE